jgi:hypothetical protein
MESVRLLRAEKHRAARRQKAVDTKQSTQARRKSGTSAWPPSRPFRSNSKTVWRFPIRSPHTLREVNDRGVVAGRSDCGASILKVSTTTGTRNTTEFSTHISAPAAT